MISSNISLEEDLINYINAVTTTTQLPGTVKCTIFNPKLTPIPRTSDYRILNPNFNPNSLSEPDRL